MTGQEIIALIGLAGTLLGIVVAAVTMYRNTASAIKEGDDALHERINRVRDDYVRRVDLDGHMTRIDQNVKEMREESREGTREINRRLDSLLQTARRPTR